MTSSRSGLTDFGEASSKILTAALFLIFAWRLGLDFVETQRPTDLLLVVGEALVVVLTCLRRPAQSVDRRAIVRLVTGLSLALPMMVRPSTAGAGLISETTAASIAALGLSIVVAGKISLGWSFGLLPANRGVMKRGLYRMVRHPIYLGYLLTHLPFLLAHPTGWNLAALVLGDIALIVRALYEEETLGRDPQYVEYCQTVKWRLVPGIC